MSKHINTSFIVDAPFPIDRRMQVPTYSWLSGIAVKYDRMKVYVLDTDTEWRYFKEDVSNPWHQVIIDTSWILPALDQKVDKNSSIIGGTATKISYDEKGLVVAGTTASIGDMSDVNKGTPVGGYVLTWDANNNVFMPKPSASVLIQELTSTITVGGITNGDVFQPGTTFEALWQFLLTGTSTPPDPLLAPTNLAATVNGQVATLTWSKSTNATSYKAFIGPTEIGAVGDVATMDITPGVGTHTIHIKAYNATQISPDSTTIDVTIAAFEFSYFGLNTSGDIPIETEILAGTGFKVSTDPSVTFNPNSTNNDYFWVAVHKATSAVYDWWEDTTDSNNASSIGVGQFIESKGEVTVNGEVYTVYMTGWQSQVDVDFRLELK